MVKAELMYNPYIRETIIKFNGQKPRVNSLVEKYQAYRLQNWIRKIPGIFYDEMNGYDFELEFSGTALDFKDLEQSFHEAGVDSEQVRLFYKNELDDRNTKQQKIERLLYWIKEQDNRHLDTTAFLEENKEIFSFMYSIIFIQNGLFETPKCSMPDIFIENIGSVMELRKTDLSNIPIVYYLEATAGNRFHNDLTCLLDRSDVIQEQLFFMIHPSYNVSIVKRFLEDIGIVSPQIIEKPDALAVLRFLEVYPQTDYICNAIQVLAQTAKCKSEELSVLNKKAEVENRGIYEKINHITKAIDRLYQAKDCFENEGNRNKPEALDDSLKDLLQKIGGWKNKRTKILNDEEAERIAGEYDREIEKLFFAFSNKVKNVLMDFRDAVSDKYASWYKETRFDDFDMVSEPEDLNMASTIPSVSKELLSMKKELYVQKKEDLLGRLFKTTKDVPELELETAYYYQEWREYAVSIVQPLAEQIIYEQFERAQSYLDNVSGQYLLHITDKIDSLTEQKEVISRQLSEDEQLLQNDNTWLTEFKNQLRDIERG